MQFRDAVQEMVTESKGKQENTMTSAPSCTPTPSPDAPSRPALGDSPSLSRAPFSPPSAWETRCLVQLFLLLCAPSTSPWPPGLLLVLGAFHSFLQQHTLCRVDVLKNNTYNCGINLDQQKRYKEKVPGAPAHPSPSFPKRYHASKLRL